jgi:hypothetical protein
MDEIYKLIIDRIAHRCTKAIIEQLLELGILAEEDRHELLRRVDMFFITRHTEPALSHLNGKYRALRHTMSLP